MVTYKCEKKLKIDKGHRFEWRKSMEELYFSSMKGLFTFEY